MDMMIQKIKTIQNKAKSLQWGHYAMSDDETMFVVGNKAYPKEPHFFVISSDYTIYFLNDSHKKILHKQCDNLSHVTSEIIVLLKEWFPAK